MRTGTHVYTQPAPPGGLTVMGHVESSGLASEKVNPGIGGLGA